MKDFVFLLFFHINEDILRKDLRINERWGITDGLTVVLASLFEKRFMRIMVPIK